MKTHRKLNLRRETLGQLDDSALRAILGGCPSDYCSSEICIAPELPPPVDDGLGF